ncbi:MAG: branched-chain amino acid transaminase [Anaerolineales bacterium]|nr:branched-chain amino acid transaminase [Anaerolineales bacterium]
MALESKYIWMNGELVEFEKANVHFLTSTMHYGLGVFEGIRCYDTPKGPAVFRLKEHAQRLIDSVRILDMPELPYTVEQIEEAILQTVKANEFAECYIRPLVYLAEGGMGLHFIGAKSGLGIAVWEWGNFLGPEAMEKGIRANIATFTRHHINVMMTKSKAAGNYVNSALAKTESLKLGFDEAIMLDPQGYVAECTGENIFLVRNGKVYTPPVATVLGGITRDALLTVARDLGYEVLEQPISRDMLYIADEVFVCGTAAEVVALSEIDFRVIGDGKTGPVTRSLQKAFQDVIRGKDPKYERWLSYVDQVSVKLSQSMSVSAD